MSSNTQGRAATGETELLGNKTRSGAPLSLSVQSTYDPHRILPALTCDHKGVVVDGRIQERGGSIDLAMCARRRSFELESVGYVKVAVPILRYEARERLHRRHARFLEQVSHDTVDWNGMLV